MVNVIIKKRIKDDDKKYGSVLASKIELEFGFLSDKITVSPTITYLKGNDATNPIFRETVGTTSFLKYGNDVHFEMISIIKAFLDDANKAYRYTPDKYNEDGNDPKFYDYYDMQIVEFRHSVYEKVERIIPINSAALAHLFEMLNVDKEIARVEELMKHELNNN